MLDPAALRAVLPGLPVQPYQGVLYRAVTLEALYGFHHNPPYPAIRPLFNLGAPAAGARCTPVGGMASLYLAADTDTAIAEINQIYAQLRRLNPPVMVPIPPCVLFSVQVALDNVLNLNAPTVQAALQTDVAELSAPWRPVQAGVSMPPTQSLGQAAFDCGLIQALQYPSGQLPGHNCYIAFTDRLSGSSFIEVSDSDGNLRERLP